MELKDSEKKKVYEGMTDEKLYKLIKPYMRDYEDKSPYLRVKKAISAWKKDDAYKREKAEESRKKADSSLSMENGGRHARESTPDELMNKKGDLTFQEKAVLREKLGIIQRIR